MNPSLGYENFGNIYGIDTTIEAYTAPLNPYCTGGLCDQSESFAWGRALDRLGIQTSPRGNACSWWTSPDVHFSRHPADEPRANSFAIWQDPSGMCDSSHPGHVAYVEEVVGDYVYINEANWDTPGFNGQTKRFTKSEMGNRDGFILQGYLHLSSPFSCYHEWVFHSQGSADWTAGNALSQGIGFDGDEYFWKIGSSFGDNTQIRQIYSPLLTTISSDGFNALEITFSESNTILGSVNAWFNINNLWNGPVVLSRVGGPGTPGSQNTYRGSITSAYSGWIQQVRVDLDQGSAGIDKSISIYHIAFNYTDPVPFSDYSLLSGFITDPNAGASQWHVVARETNGANPGNEVYTNDHPYTMALLPGNYDVHSESETYIGDCILTIASPVQNVYFPQNPIVNITHPAYDLHHITGYVTDDQGMAIPSVIVSATRDDGSCTSSGASGADGFFDLSVIPGTYTVLFSAPETTAYLNRGITGVAVSGNVALPDTILNSLVKYLLSGFFTDEDGTHTLDGYDSALINADNPSIINSVWASTNDGNFFFNLFITGSYTVTAALYSNYNNGNSETSTEATYQVFDYLNRPSNLVIPLPSYQYTFLEGTVTDIKGIALPDIRVDASELNGRCTGWSYTDSQGYYSLRLVPGQYVVTVTAPPDTFAPFQINRVVMSEDCQRNIRLSSDYTILDEAIDELDSGLDIALDVFDIVSEAASVDYDIAVEGTRGLLEIILNWAGSEMALTVYDPAGNFYDAYQSSQPPLKIPIPNPAEGTWTCEIAAVDVPLPNYPVALVAGLTGNQAPVAEASGPYSGYVNSGILLNAGNSHDNDGQIVLYEWDWNNDGIYDQSSLSPTISHTWAAPYNGTVRLRVTDDAGLTSTDTCAVNVSAQIPRYTLNASVIGGHGTVSPMSGTYNRGTVVNLTASPASGYRVKMWQGTDNNTSKSTVNTVTMNTNRTVTVEFELTPLSTYTLSVSVIGGNGTISPISGMYNQGTVVTLTATPASGYRVKVWHGTSNDTSTATTNTVTMNANRTVTVEFEPIPESTYVLTIDVDGQGTVDVSPTGVDMRYQAETIVTLTAKPNNGYELVRWEGNVDDPNNTVSTTIRMDRDQTVKAIFSQKSKGGGGGGGCFLSTSASSPLSLSGIPLMVLMSIVFMGFSYMGRYPARK